MAQIDIYNVLGKKAGTMELDDNIFMLAPHNQSMFDLVLAERAALRQGTRGVKNRSAVRGGGRKPWRQKGTGRARQGTIRAPQWRGGGVVFGPRSDQNFVLKINNKVRKLAKKSGWSQKFDENALMILDKLNFHSPKTQDFIKLLANLNIDDKKVLLVLSDPKNDMNIMLSSRNVNNVMPMYYSEVLLDDILNADVILMVQDTVKFIEGGLQ